MEQLTNFQLLNLNADLSNYSRFLEQLQGTLANPLTLLYLQSEGGQSVEFKYFRGSFQDEIKTVLTNEIEKRIKSMESVLENHIKSVKKESIPG